MENKVATRACNMCHKEVAEANFALHETHCRRFLCLCPDCDESVPRDHLDQHREEQHTQVKCSKCYQKMERCHLKDHEEDECAERLQSCQFCELELAWKELKPHTDVCGSRTELCTDCGRYVTLKDQLKHSSTCSATNSGSGPPRAASRPPNKTKETTRCSICTESFPPEDIEQHELECIPASRWDLGESESDDDNRENEVDFSAPRLNGTHKFTFASNRPSRGPWSNGGDPDDIRTCPHCHLALPLITLRWHEVKCQIHIHLK